MTTFKIKTLGCKVNQCESEDLSESMLALGLKTSKNSINTDVMIINTCAVTQKASMRSRQAIQKAIRENPTAKLIVTGCYAHTAPEEIKKIKGVEFIISNEVKHKITENYIYNIFHSIRKESLCQPEVINNTLGTYSHNNKTRSFVKIQDGCNSFCTYCIIPYARGKNKSLTKNEVFKKINTLKLRGSKEIVLTGIHIGNYGKDLHPNTNLYSLLRSILEKKYIERIRISSIEPLELSEKIIHLAKKTETKKNSLCQHFHIPLQSGDDSILKKMNRPYNHKYFIKLVKKIIKIIPDCSIGLDIIIGFPGETQTAFNNTYNVIKDLPISYLHIFPFSPRKGTPAYNYPNQVLHKNIKERCIKMKALGIQKRITFYNNFFGKTLPVLVETTRDKKTGKLKGFSENYIPIKFHGSDAMYNTIQYVKINKITSERYAEGTINENIISPCC